MDRCADKDHKYKYNLQVSPLVASFQQRDAQLNLLLITPGIPLHMIRVVIGLKRLAEWT